MAWHKGSADAVRTTDMHPNGCAPCRPPEPFDLLPLSNSIATVRFRFSSSLMNAFLRTRLHHCHRQALHRPRAVWVQEHQGVCEVLAAVRSPDAIVAMPRGALGA